MSDLRIRENLEKTLEEFDYEADCREALLAVCDDILACDESREAIMARVSEYAGGVLDWAGITEDADRLAEKVGRLNSETRMIFFMALIPYSYHFFEEKGLGYTEWYDSMIDFKWKARETKRVHGVWGTHTNWFKMFFTADRVAFGRLQFNYGKARMDFTCDEFSVKEGQMVIDIHIPEDDRWPFTKEMREAAYARARKFFAPDFEDGRVIFSCGSWLLHPDHRRILPEGSNIRGFLDDFHLVDGSFKPSNDNFWRIFGIKDYNGDPDTLPEKTSLMRAYKEYVKGGGIAGSMLGYKL